MSYINKITVGGESYALTPRIDGGAIHAVDLEGNFIDAYLFSINSYGELYHNLAVCTDNMYGLRTRGDGIICGLGANGIGAVGVYIYTGPNPYPQIAAGDTLASLARLGMTDNGAIGVYTTGMDGIYVNPFSKAVSLKLRSELVSLQSGERLGIYINPEGYLELIKV